MSPLCYSIVSFVTGCSFQNTSVSPFALALAARYVQHLSKCEHAVHISDYFLSCGMLGCPLLGQESEDFEFSSLFFWDQFIVFFFLRLWVGLPQHISS